MLSFLRLDGELSVDGFVLTFNDGVLVGESTTFVEFETVDELLAVTEGFDVTF